MATLISTMAISPRKLPYSTRATSRLFPSTNSSEDFVHEVVGHEKILTSNLMDRRPPSDPRYDVLGGNQRCGTLALNILGYPWSHYASEDQNQTRDTIIDISGSLTEIDSEGIQASGSSIANTSFDRRERLT
ncbi:hypothetical protein WG66_009468 [Moniliophthora roreri]|nr:hypothetical protein WG66_009468 [Moniliophthora roreri]